MKLRRSIGLIFLVILIICYMIFAMRDFTVFAIMLFWDLKAFIMIILIPILILLISNSPKEIAAYINTAINNGISETEAKEALVFYKSLRKILICTGIFILFFSIMMMLSDISSLDIMAKNIGTGLCGIIYGFLIVMLFILPTENTLRKQILKLHT